MNTVTERKEIKMKNTIYTELRKIMLNENAIWTVLGREKRSEFARELFSAEAWKALEYADKKYPHEFMLTKYKVYVNGKSNIRLLRECADMVLENERKQLEKKEDEEMSEKTLMIKLVDGLFVMEASEYVSILSDISRALPVMIAYARNHFSESRLSWAMEMNNYLDIILSDETANLAGCLMTELESLLKCFNNCDCKSLHTLKQIDETLKNHVYGYNCEEIDKFSVEKAKNLNDHLITSTLQALSGVVDHDELSYPQFEEFTDDNATFIVNLYVVYEFLCEYGLNQIRTQAMRYLIAFMACATRELIGVGLRYDS